MSAPIVWFADMPRGFHNPEPSYKIAGLERAGHRVLFVDQLGVNDPGFRNVAKVVRYAASALRRRDGGDAGGGPPTLRLVVAPPRHRPLTDALNDRLVHGRLRRALAAGGLSRPVLWFRFPTPELVRMIGRLGESMVVYECVDRFGAFDYPERARAALVRAESRLLELADLTIVTSEGLRRWAAPQARRLALHHHGTDVPLFASPPPVPADLAALPRPVLGYTGPIDTRLDVALLAQVARANPTASVVVVGPRAAGVDASPLDRLPNCHLLGQRPHAQIPAYVGGFDVGLLPYVRNDVTADIFPMKALEYLAAGLPAVAVDVPELRRFAEVMAVVDTPQDFLAEVGRALSGRPRATAPSRRAAVAAFDWPVRTASLARLLDDTMVEMGASR